MSGVAVRLLGPVEFLAPDDGQPVRLSVGLRAVLAVLALSPGRPVRAGTLINALWDDCDASGREQNLHVRVYQLRRRLAAAGPVMIASTGTGYRLEVDSGAVDAAAFDDLARHGREALRAGQPGKAADLLTRALQLWQGPALADVAPVSAWLAMQAAALDERRVDAVEDHAEAALGAGTGDGLAADLLASLAEHPLRERLRALAMTALYLDGRQADALALYHDGRQLLADQLGIDPDRHLQEVYLRILKSDHVLQPLAATLTAEPARACTNAPINPPRQVPVPTRYFAGRQAELAALDDLGDVRAGGMAIIGISGAGGAGKTTLALQWAKRIAMRFPDGQLYVNLRGFDPHGTPLGPGEALRGFLSALGVVPDALPAADEMLAAQFRSLTVGKHLLIVLDNAVDAGQIRPLLPASETALVLITSRDSLAGLAVSAGARLLRLGPLEAAEARQVLSARLGAVRVQRESRAAEDIITHCAGMPLALAIVAARAAANPGWHLADLAAEIAAEQGRLNALQTGESLTSVRSSFSWSYRCLSSQAARMLRLLSRHPGPDFTVAAAASLAAVAKSEAWALLGELANASMLTEQTPGRYAMHDLLRLYSAELAAYAESPDERQAAVRRLLDHYLHSAYQAATRLSLLQITVGPPAPGTSPEDIGDHAEAIAWFRAEHHVLLACVHQASRTGHDRHAWQIPWTMHMYLGGHGYIQEQEVTSAIGLAAARRLAEDTALGWAEYGYGFALYRAGSLDSSVRHHQAAAAHFDAAEDKIGAGTAYEALSMTFADAGNPEQALEAAELALECFRSVGEPSGQAYSHGLAGRQLAELGHCDEGRHRLETALRMYEEMSDPIGLTDVLIALGHTCIKAGATQDAIGHLSRADKTAAQISDSLRSAQALSGLGDAHAAAANLQAAREAWQQALELLDLMRHPAAEPVRDRIAAASSNS